MEEPQIEFLGELRIGRLYSTVRRAAAAGIVIYPGLFLLLIVPTVKSLNLAGVTAGLLAVLTLGLTLLSILEFLGGSSERAGTYALVHESLGRGSGFIAGWSILAANLALAMLFLQTASDSLMDLLPMDLPAWTVGVFFFLLLSTFQLFRWLARRDWVLPLAAFLLLALVIGLITAIARTQSGLWQTNLQRDSNSSPLRASFLSHKAKPRWRR